MKKILTEACIYNTVAVLVLYSAGALVSGKSGLIPTLQSLYMILLFCVALSAANLLLASEKFGTPLRVALHFIVVTVIFYTVFIAWGGFARNASGVCYRYAYIHGSICGCNHRLSCRQP